MRKRWVGLWIGVVGVLTLSYTYSLIAATPDELLRRPFHCPASSSPELANPESSNSELSNTEAQNVQVLSIRKWEQGVVGLYQGNCLFPKKTFLGDSPTPTSVLNYRIMQRNGTEWHAIGTGHHLRKPSPSRDRLIDYGVGQLSAQSLPSHAAQPQPSQYTLFFGQVLSPNVASVEVTFNNGKVLRDRAIDGVLLLVAAHATGICDVRILGIDRQILQREELAPPIGSPTSNRCQPISGQM